MESDKTFEEKCILFLTYIVFAYFLFRLLYFALNISHYIPPDEVSRFKMCQIFSKVLFIPEESEETYSLGLVTHMPYLYYFIMGKLLNLNFFMVSDLIFLRIFNCIISFAAIVFSYKWIKLISSESLFNLLFLILITNTPMFSFISAAVSYDNLLNLFAVTALYYLHLFFQYPTFIRFFLFGISVLSGALTKWAFIPLILAYFGVLIFRQRKNFKNMLPILKNISLNFKDKILLAFFLILLILNMMLYLENLVRFGKIVPTASQVITEEKAMKFRLYAQETILSLYQEDKITFDEAVEKAKQIEHPGDRADTLYLLNLAGENKVNPVIHLDRVQYMWTWLNLMLHRSVSIAGHIFMPKSSYIFSIYQLIFILSFIFFVRYWNPLEADSLITDAVFLSIFYGIILMQFVNYPHYLRTHAVGVYLQGKYLFPVLVPFYGIVAYFLIIPFKKLFQIIIFLFISIYFILGDFPYFLYNATPQWFF